MDPLRRLPAATWESREIGEAVAHDCPGAVIAAARRAHGLRQDQLGELAGFSQSAISRLEAGSNIAYDLRALRILQRLLGIPAHLLGVAAMYAEFHGWLHEEIGDARGAHSWTARALAQGEAAEDHDVIAYSYVRMSRLAQDDHQVIGLARAAQRERNASPAVRAMALRQEACGLAHAGDSACMDRLDLADRELARHRAEAAVTDEYRIGYCLNDQHPPVTRTGPPRWGSALWNTPGRPARR
jgi:transcriptional regulator with XRE-family HTH domain